MKNLILQGCFAISMLYSHAQLNTTGTWLFEWNRHKTLTNNQITNFSISSGTNAKPVLRWQSWVSPGIDAFFTIERSSNGTNYEVVSVLKMAQCNSNEYFEFTDEAPILGNSYYRVKYTVGQQVSISKVVLTHFSTDASCRFYPNPADKVLIVRSEMPVEVQVSDKSGNFFIKTQLEAGLRIMDVSSLPTGTYVITMVQKDANKTITERLVKK